MPEPNSFGEFLDRIRSGDQQAATELVRRYGPIIRREVRMHLTDPRMYGLCDSMDVCQSVLASFFVRAAVGQFDLAQPQQLIGLLVRMARNKLVGLARKHQAQRRDVRRLGRAGLEERALVGAGPCPSRVVESRELLQEVRRRLTEEERQLADRRSQGESWNAIATQVGGTPDGRRMQLSRALDRVVEQLGLEDKP
jgi:RNA polymerase sigma-70 factor (ECF subfamily)